jgi:hypothetical protein
MDLRLGREFAFDGVCIVNTVNSDTGREAPELPSPTLALPSLNFADPKKQEKREVLTRIW